MASAGTQYVPRTAATNFAFSYVQILLLCLWCIICTAPDPADYAAKRSSSTLDERPQLAFDGHDVFAFATGSLSGSCCAQQQLWRSSQLLCSTAAVVLSSSCCAHGSCCAHSRCCAYDSCWPQRQLLCSWQLLFSAVAVVLSGSCCAHWQLLCSAAAVVLRPAHKLPGCHCSSENS